MSLTHRPEVTPDLTTFTGLSHGEILQLVRFYTKASDKMLVTLRTTALQSAQRKTTSPWHRRRNNEALDLIDWELEYRNNEAKTQREQESSLN